MVLVTNGGNRELWLVFPFFIYFVGRSWTSVHSWDLKGCDGPRLIGCGRLSMHEWFQNQWLLRPSHSSCELFLPESKCRCVRSSIQPHGTTQGFWERQAGETARPACLLWVSVPPVAWYLPPCHLLLPIISIYSMNQKMDILWGPGLRDSVYICHCYDWAHSPLPACYAGP